MMKIVSAPEYGVLFLEDENSGDISFQCLCGGMASWWRRVVLTSSEAEEFRNGTLDTKRMMVEICQNWPSMADRVVQAVELSELS